MSDVIEAYGRLMVWLRDYGHQKGPVFVKDVATVMDAAKEAADKQAEIERLRAELRHLQCKVDHGCTGFYCQDCDMTTAKQHLANGKPLEDKLFTDRVRDLEKELAKQNDVITDLVNDVSKLQHRIDERKDYDSEQREYGEWS